MINFINKTISVNKYIHSVLIRKLFGLFIVASCAYWQSVSNFKNQISIVVDNRLNLLKYQIFNQIKTKQISLAQAIQKTLKAHNDINFSKKAGFFAFGSISGTPRHSLVTRHNKNVQNPAILNNYINNELSVINIEINQHYEKLIFIGDQRDLLFIRPFYDYKGKFMGQLKTVI